MLSYGVTRFAVRSFKARRHARLIERNIRRAGVTNEIIPFQNGTAALSYLFGADGSVYESDEPVWDEGRVRRPR